MSQLAPKLQWQNRDVMATVPRTSITSRCYKYYPLVWFSTMLVDNIITISNFKLNIQRCQRMYFLRRGVPRFHADVIKWKHFPRNWPFVQGIHRLPVNSPHKGQWRGALMFSLICAWISGWVNIREAGDLRRSSSLWHHCDVYSHNMNCDCRL